jgi:hypothetical protein
LFCFHPHWLMWCRSRGVAWLPKAGKQLYTYNFSRYPVVCISI